MVEEDITHDIKSIEIGVLSPADIQKMSTFDLIETSTKDITTTTSDFKVNIYDTQFGTLQFNEYCPACKKTGEYCQGHFSYIKLEHPVINPIYIKFTLYFLKCICFFCRKFLLSQEHLKTISTSCRFTHFKEVTSILNAEKTCTHCSTKQPKLTICPRSERILSNGKLLSERFILAHLENFTDADLRLLLIDPQKLKPEYFILTYLPIAPTITRGRIMTPDIKGEDDLSTLYIDIIKINKLLEQQLPEEKYNKLVSTLIFKINTLMVNNKDKGKNVVGKTIQSFKRRLVSKQGHIRNNCLAKRIECSARFVVGPANVSIDTVVIPQVAAKEMYREERVWAKNIQRLSKLIEENKVAYVIRNGQRINMEYALWTRATSLQTNDYILNDKQKKVHSKYTPLKLKEGDIFYRNDIPLTFHSAKYKPFKLELGDVVQRQLQDGDYALIIRYPSLWAGSLLGMKVQIDRNPDSLTLKLPLSVMSSLAGDYDGDEVNMFISNKSEYELKTLGSIRKHLISYIDGSTNIKVIQDSILAFYLASKHDRAMTREDFFQTSEVLGLEVAFVLRKLRAILKAVGSLSTRNLFSLVLPESFSFSNDSLEVEKGIVIKGIITKKEIYTISKHIIYEYGEKEYIKYVDNVHLLGCEWLTKYRGFSISLRDTYCKALETETVKNLSVAAQYEELDFEYADKKELKTISEELVQRELNNIRSKSMVIAKEALEEDNSFLVSAESGAKGNYFNSLQIATGIGQQVFNNQRIAYTLNDGQRSLPHYPIDSSEMSLKQRFESKGFVYSSFSQGLNPREFFLHSICGREALAASSIKTASSGYVQRRLCAVAQECHVGYCNEVRSCEKGRVLDFSYGLDVKEKINGKSHMFCDVKRLVGKLNNEYELERGL